MDESSKSNKVVPPKGKKTHTEMLIDPALSGGYRRVRRKSALDDEFDAEDEMQARELRDLRMEEILTKRKARIAKLKKEIEEVPTSSELGEEPRVTGISINLARQIALLPEEERQRVIETYVILQAAEAKRADAMLPAMVGFAKANPGSPKNEMVEFAKAMTQQLETGVKIGQAGKETVDPYKPMELMMDMVKENRREASSDPWKPVELMMDLVKETVKEPIKELSDRMQPQPSVFEQILTNDALFQRAKEIGIFGRHDSGAATSDMDLKIEQLRTERDLELKKIDLEWKKSMLERDAQDKRTDAVLTALAPLSAVFAGPVNQRMRQLGQQQAASHEPPVDVPPQSSTIMLRCSCGYEGTKTFIGSPPKIIKCPNCNNDLVVGGPTIGGEPQETD
jgi:hypothetical protein